MKRMQKRGKDGENVKAVDVAHVTTRAQLELVEAERRLRRYCAGADGTDYNQPVADLIKTASETKGFYGPVMVTELGGARIDRVGLAHLEGEVYMDEDGVSRTAFGITIHATAKMDVETSLLSTPANREAARKHLRESLQTAAAGAVERAETILDRFEKKGLEGMQMLRIGGAGEPPIVASEDINLRVDEEGASEKTSDEYSDNDPSQPEEESEEEEEGSDSEETADDSEVDVAAKPQPKKG